MTVTYMAVYDSIMQQIKVLVTEDN